MVRTFPRLSAEEGQLTLLALVLATALTSACDSPSGPSELSDEVPDVSLFVTPDVRSQLDADGHYLLPRPTSWGSRALMGPEEARRLALAFVRFAARSTATLPSGQGLVFESFVTSWERTHGKSVDWAKATSTDRDPPLSLAIVEPLPAEAIDAVHNFWGPHYQVPILVDGVPVLSVAVSAPARSVAVSDAGSLVFANPEGVVGGNEFFATGVPLGSQQRPVPPEVATRLIFDAFGVRIAATPRLVQPGLFITPEASNWEFRLESAIDVRVRATGEVRRADRIYVGDWPNPGGPIAEGPAFRIRLYIAAPDQPVSQPLFLLTSLDEPPENVEWPTVPDTPVLFLEVEPVG